MSHIIGRGRYARAVYPIARVSGGGGGTGTGPTGPAGAAGAPGATGATGPTGFFGTLQEDGRTLAASLTTLDGDVACATGLPATPVPPSPSGGAIQVFVNGVSVDVGNGVKTLSCYFSADGGVTARSFSALSAGDLLYWNGSIAGFQLETADIIDFNYLTRA